MAGSVISVREIDAADHVLCRRELGREAFGPQAIFGIDAFCYTVVVTG